MSKLQDTDKTPRGAARARKKRAGKSAALHPGFAPGATKVASGAKCAQQPESHVRQAAIAETAHNRAELGAFAPGCESSYWLAAEAEVDARLGKAERQY